MSNMIPPNILAVGRTIWVWLALALLFWAGGGRAEDRVDTIRLDWAYYNPLSLVLKEQGLLMNAVRRTDRKLVEVGLANGFRGFTLVKTIVLPATLPVYLIGLRQGLSLGWMFVVAAEIMGASRGLGYLLIDGQATGRPAIMSSSVILFASCGKLSDGILAALSERWLSWQDVYRN
jgi:hypothetical protein